MSPALLHLPVILALLLAAQYVVEC